MKKMLATVALFAILAGFAVAGDGNPSLLCNIPCPAPTPAPACEPPPPVCAPPPPVCPPPPPAPACEPPPPVCAPPPPPACPPAPHACDSQASSGKVKAARQPEVTQYRVVPVKKKVYEEETYTVNETRTQINEEVRTRQAKLKAPRLARVVRDDGIALVVHKDKPRTETYTVKVKNSYEVPVTKTRTVAKEVEEYKVVEDKRWRK